MCVGLLHNKDSTYWRGEQQRQTQMGVGSGYSLAPSGKRGEMEKGKAMLEVLLLRWVEAELLRDETCLQLVHQNIF